VVLNQSDRFQFYRGLGYEQPLVRQNQKNEADFLLADFASQSQPPVLANASVPPTSPTHKQPLSRGRWSGALPLQSLPTGTYGNAGLRIALANRYSLFSSSLKEEGAAISANEKGT
jgi:hypothetical protein